MSNEVKEIKPEDQKILDGVAVKSEEDCSDIFITENDTFDVAVEYYKKDGVLYVDGVDENFDKTAKTKKISMTFKNPSQGDAGLIAIQSAYTKTTSPNGDMSVRDFLALEFHRFNVLLRKWSLNKEINNANVLSINPKIIKAFLSRIREKAGMDGII